MSLIWLGWVTKQCSCFPLSKKNLKRTPLSSYGVPHGAGMLPVAMTEKDLFLTLETSFQPDRLHKVILQFPDLLIFNSVFYINKYSGKPM